MRETWLRTTIIIWLAICSQTAAFTVTRGRGSGEVARKDGVNGEPSCEELKAMWRFSKRQSRAAEATNEIPTYRDPFSYNVWEPYYVARSRSIGGMRLGRHQNRPIYGTVIHRAPSLRVQDMAERQKAFEEVARTFGTLHRGTEPRRKFTAFRLGGGRVPSMRLSPQSGSFQHLKELIRTERARELQEQRMAEEVAARAAALSGLNGRGNYKNQPPQADMAYNYEMERQDDAQREGEYPGQEGVVAFPDILAPATRLTQEDYQPQEYYSRDMPYHKSHRSSYYDFDNGMDDLSL